MSTMLMTIWLTAAMAGKTRRSGSTITISRS
jgi:hypothetical protein